MATRKPKRARKSKASKKSATKRPAKKQSKKAAPKRARKKSATKSAAKPSKRAPKKSAKKSAAKKTAVGTKAPKLERPPAKKQPTVKQAAKTSASKKPRQTKRARAAAKTVPGGTAPMDDLTIAKRALKDLREVLSRVSDADAEVILGDGALDRLIAAIVPPARDGAPHEHLAAHKRRASLLARLRHGVNERSAYRVGDRFVSPTRVQWFYDGLTFLEGSAPYEGVVALFRDGVVRYGLNVVDASRDTYLGPLEADFVSVAESRKAFRGSDPDEGLAALAKLAGADDPDAWIAWLIANPWALGAQHASVERVTHRDEALPRVTAKRSTDGAQDVLLVESPHTAVVGKNGRVLSSFRDTWVRAEQQRMFVQRQTGFLKRELGWKIRDPRFIVLAGSGLSRADRDAVRDELEKHHASIRLVTFDELEALARRTVTFFSGKTG